MYPSLSVIIPTTNSPVGLHRFVAEASEHARYARVQFVFLINSRVPHMPFYNEFKFGRISVIEIGNDRYFGTCEENLYRVRDIISELMDYVVCVGEHDRVDWSGLLDALYAANNKDLDVLGWNLRNVTILRDGSRVETDSLCRINVATEANKTLDRVFSGELSTSDIAFPALISCYGPIDWAAYLGNHLYRREIFNAVVSPPSFAPLYSFVLNQVKLLSLNDYKYGFSTSIVIDRISDELTKESNETELSWLHLHRRVAGASSNIGILPFYSFLEDRCLFNLVLHSHCLSLRFDPVENRVVHTYNSSFYLALIWIGELFDYFRIGKSFYNPSLEFRSMSDLWFANRFLELLERNTLSLAEEMTGESYNLIFDGLRETRIQLEKVLCGKKSLGQGLQKPSEFIKAKLAILKRIDTVKLMDLTLGSFHSEKRGLAPTTAAVEGLGIYS